MLAWGERSARLGVQSFHRRQRMDQAEITASPKLRIIFAVVGAIMLALWGWSLVSPIENWGNPNEDGFSYVPVFYSTPICLPAGFFLLAGTISGRGRRVANARIALFLGCGVLFIVGSFLIFQHIANSNDGKIFGIQVGSYSSGSVVKNNG